jgi:hypothetical protein
MSFREERCAAFELKLRLNCEATGHPRHAWPESMRKTNVERLTEICFKGNQKELSSS